MFDFSVDALKQTIIWLPIILLSIAIHEFAHCWTTDRLGDDTPRRAGRVTLNPIAHIDPRGILMMLFAAFSGIGFGWGKSAPFQPGNLRNPQRDRMLTALAGPVSNVLQAIVWASLLGIIRSIAFANGEPAAWADTVLMICVAGVYINIGLALFNLLPIFPLDGHHILGYFVSHEIRRILDDPRWIYVFFAIMFIYPLRQLVLGPLRAAIEIAAGWMIRTIA